VSADRAAGLRDPRVTDMLRAIGPRWQLDIRAASEAVKAFYLPRLEAAPRDGVERLRDLPYGPDPRQVLDVYRPAGARQAPVVAFVHGGAFVRGDKDTQGRIYGNVLTWFARQGCIGINVEYRLAPDAPYPGGALDVGLACEWIGRHVQTHGGDPGRLCLVGHSAGGTHVASLLCDPLPAVRERRHGATCAVLVSARLRADVLPSNPNAGGVRAYFGADPAQHEQASPVTHAARMPVPVLVVNAQYENPLLDLYGLEFALALGRARGAAPLHIALADHNHMSIMAHFNTEEAWLGGRILDFFEAACRPGSC
jgi:acetyl esterase